MANSKAYTPSDEEFRQIVASSKTITECKIALGYSSKSGRQPNDLIKKRCEELSISTEHFQPPKTQYTHTYSLEEIMVENSSYTNTTHLKKRIINAGLLEYKCAICGNKGEWNNQPLVLQLDHINGCHNDHRLENLRFLCLNCHSQTETFSRKQRRANP